MRELQSGVMFFPRTMLHLLKMRSIFLGPHLWHIEVLRLGVKSELQLPAYAAARAMQDLSHICDLHHSLRQCQIVNPLRPGIEPASLWILFGFVTRWATMGTLRRGSVYDIWGARPAIVLLPHLLFFYRPYHAQWKNSLLGSSFQFLGFYRLGLLLGFTFLVEVWGRVNYMQPWFLFTV